MSSTEGPTATCTAAFVTYQTGTEDLSCLLGGFMSICIISDHINYGVHYGVRLSVAPPRHCTTCSSNPGVGGPFFGPFLLHLIVC